jgi:hypothetical protein
MKTKPTLKQLPNKKLQDALRKNLSRRKQNDDNPKNAKEDNQKNDQSK